MTTKPRLLFVGLVLLASAAAQAQSQHIQYAGVLEKDGVPHNGTVTMRFGIFVTADASCLEGADLSACDAAAKWSQEIADVPVASGRFSVRLGPVSKAGLEADPQLIGVAVLDGTTWRKLGDAAPLDPTARAHTAGQPDTLLSQMTVVPAPTSPPYSVAVAVDGPYPEGEQSATIPMTPLSSSLCYLTMHQTMTDSRYLGTVEDNNIVFHRHWCAVRPNTTTNNWELTAYLASGYGDRPGDTACQARCLVWR